MSPSKVHPTAGSLFNRSLFAHHLSVKIELQKYGKLLKWCHKCLLVKLYRLKKAPLICVWCAWRRKGHLGCKVELQARNRGRGKTKRLRKKLASGCFFQSTWDSTQMSLKFVLDSWKSLWLSKNISPRIRGSVFVVLRVQGSHRPLLASLGWCSDACLHWEGRILRLKGEMIDS